MKLSTFLKRLFLQCRLNVLRIPKDSWLVVHCKDVMRASQLATEINKVRGCWQGIIVASDDISVSTIREIPEETRARLLKALLDAGE